MGRTVYPSGVGVLYDKFWGGLFFWDDVETGLRGLVIHVDARFFPRTILLPRMLGLHRIHDLQRRALPAQLVAKNGQPLDAPILALVPVLGDLAEEHDGGVLILARPQKDTVRARDEARRVRRDLEEREVAVPLFADKLQILQGLGDVERAIPRNSGLERFPDDEFHLANLGLLQAYQKAWDSGGAMLLELSEVDQAPRRFSQTVAQQSRAPRELLMPRILEWCVCFRTRTMNISRHFR